VTVRATAELLDDAAGRSDLLALGAPPDRPGDPQETWPTSPGCATRSASRRGSAWTRAGRDSRLMARAAAMSMDAADATLAAAGGTDAPQTTLGL